MSRRRKHRGAGAHRGGPAPTSKDMGHPLDGRGTEAPFQGRLRHGSTKAGGKGFAQQVIPRAWRDWIAAKKPVWRFTLLLFAGLVLFYAGYALFSASRYMDPLLRLIASISAGALSALGHEARADGALVTGPAFAFRVVRGCDGLEPIGFLLAAALATSAAVRMRCMFALVGGVFLLLLNLIRLVSMALADVYFPRLTEAIHENAWPAVIIVVVVLLWVCWVRCIRLTGHAIRQERI